MKRPATITDMGYPGAKAGAGVAERIIGQMPVHRTYVELFAGSAAVFRRKRRAERSILVDEDPRTCEALRAYVQAEKLPFVAVVCADALNWLHAADDVNHGDTLIYCDPPYLASTRTRLFYDHEFATEAEHRSLLYLLCNVRAMSMVSGYSCKLYRQILKCWRRVDYLASTRGGPRVESLWCDFAEPELLHDSRFAGRNRREREQIKRKRLRWVTRFAAMRPAERQVIAEALAQCDPATLQAAAGTAAATRRSSPPERTGEVMSMAFPQCDGCGAEHPTGMCGMRSGATG